MIAQHLGRKPVDLLIIFHEQNRFAPVSLDDVYSIKLVAWPLRHIALLGQTREVQLDGVPCPTSVYICM
jgi:hypothetical protein